MAGSKGLELSRQITVDLEPDEDFNQHWRCPGHRFVLRFTAVVATDGYTTEHINRKKCITRGQRLSNNFSTTTRPAGHVPSILESCVFGVKARQRFIKVPVDLGGCDKDTLPDKDTLTVKTVCAFASTDLGLF